VSPGFFRSQPIAYATSSTPDVSTTDPADNPAAPDIEGNLDPTTKAKIDLFVSKLNLGDVNSASALLCKQSNVNPDDIKRAANGHKLVVHSYTMIGNYGTTDAMSAEFSGPTTPTSGDDLSGNVTAGSDLSGVNCLSSMYVSS
jgi:hypothetical protein